MQTILTDTSEPALVNAIKANFHAFFDALEHAPSVAFERGEAITRSRTQLAHPFFQSAIVTRDAPGQEAQLVRETRDFFAAQGVPGFCWWFGQDVDWRPWEGALRAHGFSAAADPPGMALVLDELTEPDTPRGLVIVPVRDQEMLHEWGRTFGVGYGLPPEMSAQFLLLIREVGGAMQHYLAYLDGVPVATTSLFPAAGVAGIYDVATLPDARGRGIGAAVTVAALRDARTMGYHAAILQSSDMGFRVYQRLGFRHLCAMDHFVWLAEQ
jgi:GNAT superfamily N-acetyltransferase